MSHTEDAKVTVQQVDTKGNSLSEPHDSHHESHAAVYTQDPPQWRIEFERQREWLRPYFAECVATMLYVIFGCGAIAMFLLSEGQMGSLLNISLAFGFGIAFAVYLSAPISGGHTSPAITICFAIFKGFPWRRVPGYFVAQVIGAFLGAGFVWLNFYSTISNIDGGIHTITGLTKTGTSAIFVALPASYVSVGYQIWVEFFSDALFTFLVWMFIDTKSPAFIPSIAPILIGLIIAVVAMSTSLEGIVLNPARDLGPRIFAAIVYGPGVFTGGNYFFWIPLVVPFFGCITGAGLYDLMFQVYPRKGDPLPAH
ncbi:aquaporin-like protein [Jimgerdemannia flammicorona]|uniref:Aquaporin-like protein n=1 Tax=Jimgerdemannia flammicorona TaxID=994334 RepID=A0A433Q9C0_9FUNG|nr:aquaporin-like protein [Jimgerdemannia flammicorona]